MQAAQARPSSVLHQGNSTLGPCTRSSSLATSSQGLGRNNNWEANFSVFLQDLDVDMRLALAKGAHGALIRQIEADAALLARMGVMDYSLLLGVHYPKWGDEAWFPPGSAHTVSAVPPTLIWPVLHKLLLDCQEPKKTARLP